jgi:dTDP-4-amino-4,6-dideoxygalactose transaminase
VNNTSIPMIDLAAAHAEIADEVAAGFARILSATAFVGGPEVEGFEQEYAAFAGVRHCVGTANGTDALELALRAVGVGPGDEVVVPANSFVATAEAVARAGARPVFVDCDPWTYLIDVDGAVDAIGSRTKAVVPVHLYGQMAAVDQLAARLSGTGVRIVEDAAQCQGATRAGRPPGAGPGSIAATSFYPGKNLGAYGDAGAVLTDDPELAATVRRLGSHGGHTKYAHDVIGVNSRLDALQAVVLRAKLRRLAGWNAARRSAAAHYDKALAGFAGVTTPTTQPDNEHVWHLYVVRLDTTAAVRDAVVAALNAQGVGAAVHYPAPIHLTPAFAALGPGAGALPNVERLAGQILSLPLHPHITIDQQDRVVAALAAAVTAVDAAAAVAATGNPTAGLAITQTARFPRGKR